MGSLHLSMPSETDFGVKLTEVYVTEGTGFNLLSLHQAQSRQAIVFDSDGALVQRATCFFLVMSLITRESRLLVEQVCAVFVKNGCLPCLGLVEREHVETCATSVTCTPVSLTLKSVLECIIRLRLYLPHSLSSSYHHRSQPSCQEKSLPSRLHFERRW